MPLEQLIDGKKIGLQMRQKLSSQIAEQVSHGRQRPSLHVILVGADPASHVYVGHKEKACQEVGIKSTTHRLSEKTTQSDLNSLIQSLSQDTEVDGILLQLPLPLHLNSFEAIECIEPSKDVDGLCRQNQGALALGVPNHVPCTPKGVMHLLRQSGVQTEGALAVVIGRSKLVGQPMQKLLSLSHATVIGIHSRTLNPAELSRQADILVVASGQMEMVDRSWIKPGSVVIDVGIHRKPDGKLTGDVCPSAVKDLARLYTPVPGGVGPMTIFCLLENTFYAKYQRG